MIPSRRRTAWLGAALIPCLTLALVASGGEGAVSSIEARLRSHVAFLADDAREGREPGTVGIETAAAYIAALFRETGLKPAPGADGYYQDFALQGPASLGKGAELVFQGAEGKTLAAQSDDFSPLAIGTSGELDRIPVVFAGYGITAKDESLKLDYDDYANLDVKGKAVVILRHEPRQDDEKSPFNGKNTSDYGVLRHKATNAFQHGAVAVLMVNDNASRNGGADELLGFAVRGAEANSAIPFMMVKRDLIERVLVMAGEPSLTELETQIDAELQPRSRLINGWTLKASVKITHNSVETRNIVGVIEGSGPLAHETIVVGAHYDHLGRGGFMSGSLDASSKEIHNGADDNASGTALMLEMARRLAHRADPPPRRVVFIAFSGEEKGLLGSEHYVKHPLFPLKDTVAMINFDMVGRLNEKNELTVYGTGTSPGFDSLVDALGKSEGFTIKKISEGFGPSDQQSFYVKDIPVLFAFTGTHTDYHRPSDDTDRLNFSGMARIADLSELLLLDLVRRPQRPAFVKVAASHGHGGGDPGRVSITAYLGSIPDYNEDIKGVKLNGVRQGSPAEKGGLRKDDVIVQFNGKPVATIYDYTESLARCKPDQTVEVIVLREGKETKLKVTLGRKPSE